MVDGVEVAVVPVEVEAVEEVVEAEVVSEAEEGAGVSRWVDAMLWRKEILHELHKWLHRPFQGCSFACNSKDKSVYGWDTSGSAY